MSRTVTVKKIKRGWRVYVYDSEDHDPGAKSISRTFKTKSAATKAAAGMRQKAIYARCRKSDADMRIQADKHRIQRKKR